VPSVTLNDDTLRQRKPGCCANASAGVDTLIVYADKEHGGNFEYLTGFIPVSKRRCWYCIGTVRRCWCWVMKISSWQAIARLENRVIHAPWFSLPNQPMSNEKVWLSCCRMPALRRENAGPGRLEAVYRQR
jgi:hypothetical protein